MVDKEKAPIPPIAGNTSDRRSIAESVYCSYVRQFGECDIEDLCRRRPGLEADLRVVDELYRRGRRLLDGLRKRPVPADSFTREAVLAKPPSDAERADRSRNEEITKGPGDPPSEDRYVVRGCVGEGGMGAILEVWDQNLGRPLAMKVLRHRADEDPVLRAIRFERARARLAEESYILGQMDHPGIIPVYERSDSADATPYFTMRLVRGDSLAETLRLLQAGDDSWPLKRVLSVLVRVCETVAYAHARGIVHRDLKPANIMVGRFGEAYVMDWGLAKMLGRHDTRDTRIRCAVDNRTKSTSPGSAPPADTSPSPGGDVPLLTMDGEVVGTPHYMAPEQASGRLDELTTAVDVYSIGAILYHALADSPPFADDPSGSDPRVVLSALLAGPPTPLRRRAPRAPAELVAIANRAMRRDPRERYSSALEIAEDLRAFVEGRVVRAHRTGLIAEYTKVIRRHRLATVSLGVAFMGLLAVALFQLTTSRRMRDLNADLESNHLELQEAHAELRARNAEIERESYFNKISLATHALEADPIRMRALLASTSENIRDWEWHYLDRQSDTSDALWSEIEPSRIYAAALSARSVATLNRAGQITVWDLPTGEVLRRLRVQEGSFGVGLALSTDGALLTNWTKDAELYLWNTESGELLLLDRGDRAAFSRDGRLLLALAPNRGAVRLWAIDSRKLLREIPVEESRATAACFSWNGSAIFVGDADGFVSRYDVTTGHRTSRMHVGDEQIDYIRALSRGAADGPPRGDILCTSATRVCVLHDDEVHPIASDLPNGRDFSSSADGLCLASVTNDRHSSIATVRTFRGASPTVRALVGHDGIVLSTCVSDDGKLAVTTDSRGEIRLWNLEAPARSTAHPVLPDLYFPAQFDADGFLVTPGRDGTIGIIDVGRRILLDTIDTSASLRGLAVAPNGKTIAVGDTRGTLRFFDRGTGRLLSETDHVSTGQLRTIDYHPEGHRVVAGGWDGSLSLLEAPSGDLLWTRQPHLGGLEWVKGTRDVRFLPKRGTILSVGCNGALIETSLDGTELFRWVLPHDRLESLSIGPDEDVVAVGTSEEDHPAMLIDLSKREVLWTASRAASPVISKDGSRVFATDSSLKVLDAATGRLIVAFPDEIEPTIAISPDGTTIASSKKTEGGYALRFWESAPWPASLKAALPSSDADPRFTSTDSEE